MCQQTLVICDKRLLTYPQQLHSDTGILGIVNKSCRNSQRMENLQTDGKEEDVVDDS